MATHWRRWRLPALIAVVFVACGCNLISLPYFLLFGYDHRIEPLCPVFNDPKTDIKILLAASIPPETRQEFIRADRDLCEALARRLTQEYKEAKAKITLVPVNQVESYKDKHPGWQLNMVAMGNCFHADYVISLDLDKLSLYLADSNSQFFQGHAEVSATVLDVNHPDENPVVWRKDATFMYPRHGPESIFDTPNPAQFRARFLDYMVKEMSRWFASYTNDDKYSMDE
jgi:hypothetical protein